MYKLTNILFNLSHDFRVRQGTKIKINKKKRKKKKEEKRKRAFLLLCFFFFLDFHNFHSLSFCLSSLFFCLCPLILYCVFLHCSSVYMYADLSHLILSWFLSSYIWRVYCSDFVLLVNVWFFPSLKLTQILLFLWFEFLIL